jgi:FKBP-type peptidyl-prolyl cis-trans isomerase 2
MLRLRSEPARPGPVARASQGDTVRIHYTGWLTNGVCFDSSRGDDPRELTIGAADVIAGVENAVAGMAVGERKRVVVPPAEAYGPKLGEYLVEIARSRLPAASVQVNDLMEIHGSPVLARVAELRGEMVLMDLNHPLAGEDLTFEIELLEIVPSCRPVSDH